MDMAAKKWQLCRKEGFMQCEPLNRRQSTAWPRITDVTSNRDGKRKITCGPGYGFG